MNTDFGVFLQSLPIYSRKEEIVAAVDRNQVTVITAETGAGKSTQVPQYLAEHGYRKVIVTQPRILAARNLSMRVREEYSWRIGKDATPLVGYRTAHERDDDPDNVILYCTDGLQLVRELTGSGVYEQQVLVLDEIHEWNENMEVLLAWAKKRCQEEPGFKIVLMSATIEADELAKYFNTEPPITVEGRSYPVEKRHGRDLLTEIIETLEKQQSNMLVFLPGKAEIENIAEVLKEKIEKDIPIIPLHSQLQPDEQQLAFESYPKGKVVLSTNVAQTSVTIDDIDVVIDSGLERRSEVRSGVEGLFLAEVSQADCLQRAGRAGRTKEGLYILAQLDDLPCPPLEDRPEYGVPEIMRKHIDRLVLRLANISIDIESLEFYHSPSKKTIKLAKRTLMSLGALTDHGDVTNIGRSMERFPVESSYARMLVQAEGLPAEMQSKLAAIIAIQEVGGIVRGGSRYTGWKSLTKQTQSDLLAQYDVYLAAPTIDEESAEEMGIISKNVDKAGEVVERLHRDLSLGEPALTPVQSGETEALLKSIVAGQLHNVWLVDQGAEAIHIVTDKRRELSGSSVLTFRGLVTGTPFDLEVPTSHGLDTLHLVNDLTAVKPEWLKELAPESFSFREGKVYFDASYGTLARRIVMQHKNKAIEVASAPIMEHSKDNEMLFVTLYSKWLHERLQRERKTLQAVNRRSIPSVSPKEVQQKVRKIASGAISLLELSKKDKIELSKLGRLEAYVGTSFMGSLNSLERENHWRRHRKRSWQPKHKRRR